MHDKDINTVDIYRKMTTEWVKNCHVKLCGEGRERRRLATY